MQGSDAQKEDHRLVRRLGPLDATQRLRLAEIAEMCPVQRTLQKAPLTEELRVQKPEPLVVTVFSTR